jgi:Tfp pilus assembly protein FimT
MLVCSFLGALTAFSAPLFRASFHRLAAETGARRLASMLTYARERSVMDGVAWRVRANVEKNTFWPESQDAASAAFSKPKDRLSRTQTLAHGITLSGERDAVLFRPDGTAEEASFEIRSEQKDVFRVSVDPLTGRAQVREEDAR